MTSKAEHLEEIEVKKCIHIREKHCGVKAVS